MHEMPEPMSCALLGCGTHPKRAFSPQAARMHSNTLAFPTRSRFLGFHVETHFNHISKEMGFLSQADRCAQDLALEQLPASLNEIDRSTGAQPHLCAGNPHRCDAALVRAALPEQAHHMCCVQQDGLGDREVTTKG